MKNVHFAYNCKKCPLKQAEIFDYVKFCLKELQIPYDIHLVIEFKSQMIYNGKPCDYRGTVHPLNGRESPTNPYLLEVVTTKRDDTLETIAHELTHLMQFATKKLRLTYDNCHMEYMWIWNGKAVSGKFVHRCNTELTDDYYKLGWEKEARKEQKRIAKKWSKRK